MQRQALRTNVRRVQQAISKSLPAPTGGWNTRDPLANMKPEYAVILDNWIPRAGYVELRKGDRVWCNNAPAPVESLMVYRGDATGGDQVYAVSDGDIYDATLIDTTFTSPVYTGLSNSRMQYLNFANDGGAFLIGVNGEDTPIYWDNATWDTLTITGSSGSITLDPDTLIDLVMHKRRLFFVEKDSLHVWYLGTDAIQGDAKLLDLGPVFQQGGIIASIGTWSLDGGQGQDDYLAIFSTQGEVAIYQGTDPDDDLVWSLVGVFVVGFPLGRRSLLKYGSDLLVLTTNGVIPLSQALSLDRAKDETVAITAQIQPTFQTSSQAYFDNFGWCAITYQQAALAIYNVPVDELTTSLQYVQNLQTGAWCSFSGLNAFCWDTTDESIFYGGLDAVYQWNVGVTDHGNDLECDLQTAFSTFGQSGRIKHFTMIQPVLNATANVRPAIEMLVDFEDREPTSVPTTTISDRTDVLEIRKDWTSVVGDGAWGAVRMQAILSADPLLTSTLADGDGNDIVDGDGNLIAIDSGEPVTAQIQCIGFNTLFEPGGVL